jgi:hypothetical protein
MKKNLRLLFLVVLAVIAWWFATVAYTWLANGDLFAFLLTFVSIPFVAYGLHFVYQIDHEFFQHKIQWLVGKLFWTCVIWAFLPAIINGLSLAVDQLGFPHQSDLLFKWRYASVIAVPFCLLVAAVFVFFINEVCYSCFHGWIHRLIVVFKRWCKRHLWHARYARD